MVAGGQSYWKTSVTAPVVMEHPTLVASGVVIGSMSERHTCDRKACHKTVLDNCSKTHLPALDLFSSGVHPKGFVWVDGAQLSAFILD